MKAAQTQFILAGDRAWWIVTESAGVARTLPAPYAPNAGPREIATAVKKILASRGYAGGPILLALPTAWCYSASISTADLPRGDANALLFRFEEQLPFAAESVAADFVAVGDAALGVCTKLDLLSPLIAALDAEGVDVFAVAPAAMLAVQGCGITDSSLLVLPDPEPQSDQLNAFALHDAKPTKWLTMTAPDAAAQIQLLSTNGPPNRVRMTSDVPDDSAAAIIQSLNTNDPEQLTQTSLDTMAIAAKRVAAGEMQPWINLRRNALTASDPMRRHRAGVNGVLAAAAALFIAVAVVCAIRAHRYARAEAQAQQQLEQEFLAQFPSWSGPINVAIIESEHRRIAAARGATLPMAERGSALKILADVLGKMPPQSKYSIQRMTFNDASFELEGRVDEYDDVNTLAAAVRSTGLTVPPPQARKTGDVWDFVLRGSREGESLAAQRTQ